MNKIGCYTGAISYIGKVGEVEPPHIISPITIEPTKPRLCLNLMYLNCFMKDTPFSLDSLQDVPNLIKANSFMTKLDDKSAYMNMKMTENSRPLLCFQWGGHYFCSNTLIFGWKNSGFIYHSVNLQVMSYLRSMSITGLLYIDDRLLEDYNGDVPSNCDNPYSRACIATRLTVKLLVSLGFYLGIDKCIFDPCQKLIFLGMWVDSVERSFFVTEKRKQKISSLRKLILSKETVVVSCIQKFIGLCISVVMAIPAAKLYTACCNRAISKGVANHDIIRVEGELKEELVYWQFLDTWDQPFPWLSDRHNVLTISTDSSDYKWGACYQENGKQTQIGDYWDGSQTNLPIMIKETLALKNALLCLGTKLEGQRVHAHVDNKVLVYSWANQYSTSPQLNAVLKEIFQVTFKLKCSLVTSYISSSMNPADMPSRKLQKSDATLSKRAWLFIQYLFGPHTVDMFSLDSNAMCDDSGEILKHFTPFPSPISSGVDAFSQPFTAADNCYAFPPFCLLSAVIKFIIQEKLNCTLIFPDLTPVQPWFTLVQRFATVIVPVGLMHDTGVILYPSKRGFLADKKGLQSDLRAARFLLGDLLTYPLKNIYPGKLSGAVVPVLLVGDSMIRFLQGENDFSEVISHGGAKLQDFTFGFLQDNVQRTNPYLLLFHAGTNNVNKRQLTDSFSVQPNVRQVFEHISVLQSRYCFAVGISGCIYTKSTQINKRVNFLNEILVAESKRFRFYYIDNSNIGLLHLRDFVHLNGKGEEIMRNNLKSLI